MLLVPILTMRLFSEEFRAKTDQLLLTSPVGIHSMVYGKFFAAYLVFAIGSAITIIYALIMEIFAPLDWNSMVGNILGLLLLGGALISMGLFISSLTQSQVIAAVGSFGLILVFMLSLIHISQHIRVWERHTTVYNKHILAAFKASHVLSNFI